MSCIPRQNYVTAQKRRSRAEGKRNKSGVKQAAGKKGIDINYVEGRSKSSSILHQFRGDAAGPGRDLES